MSSLPCPNPLCAHFFQAEQLQTSGEVACPACGFRLQGRGAARLSNPAPPRPSATPLSPTAKSIQREIKKTIASRAAKVTQAAGTPANTYLPSVPVAAPVAAPVARIAEPVPAAMPVAAAVAAPANEPTFRPEDIDVELVDEAPLASPMGSPGSPAVHAHLDVHGGRMPSAGERPALKPWLTRALIIAASVLVGLLVVGTGFTYLGWLLLQTSGKGLFAFGRTYNCYVRNFKGVEEHICTLTLSDREWRMDNQYRSRLSALTAWKNNEEEVWFAIAAKDFGMTKPRDAEMLRLGIERLEGFFGEALELDSKAVGVNFAGQRAQRLTFRGTESAVVWNGECYMFFVNGVALWFYVASADHEIAQRWAAELQQDSIFALTVARQGWREQPPKTDTHASPNSAISLSALSEVWERQSAKDIDEKGVLFLFGRKDKNNRKNASVLVFTVERQGDLGEAMKNARTYTEEKKREENSKYAFAPVDKDAGELGEVIDIGNRRGRVVDFQMLFDGKPTRYLLLAVVDAAEQTYAIRCECAWESRQIWREDFLDLLRTVHVSRKGE